MKDKISNIYSRALQMTLLLQPDFLGGNIQQANQMSNILPFLIASQDSSSDESDLHTLALISALSANPSAAQNPSSLLPLVLMNDGKTDMKNLYFLLGTGLTCYLIARLRRSFSIIRWSTPLINRKFRPITYLFGFSPTQTSLIVSAVIELVI